MIAVTQTTYAPDGSLFAPATKPIQVGRLTLADAVQLRRNWIEQTGRQYIITASNQVAVFDNLGFLDVYTYEEMQ